MKLQKIALGLVFPLISACSDNVSLDNFKLFDEFKEKDVAGMNIDCTELTNAIIVRKGTILSPNRHDYEDDALDYLFHSEYTFKQCNTELEEKLNAYCEESRHKIKGVYINGYYIERKYKVLCEDVISKDLAKINYKYIMPSKSNKFINFIDSGEMVDPADIKKLVFSEKSENFWEINVIQPDSVTSLFYGNKKNWEKAILNISRAATEASKS